MDRIDEKQQESPPQPTAKPVHDPHVGNIIGERYEVLELIGKGGMGNVYKVRHIQLKKNLALKLLSAGKDGFDRTRLARFDSEAKAASGLNHPNLTGLHDYGTTADGAPYLVMDYFEGETLAQRIASSGAMDEREALNVFLQLCDGLMYAHAKGIIHRDIKPSNIILTTENGKTSARIVDFGIAKTLQQNESGQPMSATLTQTGEVVGSPPYMSPEQCLGHNVGLYSDIYSLGCTLFEAVTGVPVFTGDNVVAVMFKHINERPPLFKTVAPDRKISHSLERVIMQMLEKEADNRYHSIADLKRDLELIRAGKNPVKEMSRLRLQMRAAAIVGKVGVQLLAGGVICAIAMQVGLNLYVQNAPAWKKLLVEGQKQMSIGPNNYAEAEGYFSRAFAVAEEKHASPSDKADILVNLARVQLYTKQYANRTQTLKQAASLPGLGPEDIQRGFIYDEMAIDDLDKHDYLQAERDAREAKRLKIKHVGRITWFTGHSVARLVEALKHQKRYPEAEAEAHELVDIETKLYPNKDNVEVADAYFQLAEVLSLEGKRDEALTHAQTALKLEEQLTGATNPKTRAIAKWIGAHK